MYEHVAILNRNGIDASILHENKGFKIPYFEQEVRVVYWSSQRFPPLTIVERAKRIARLALSRGQEIPSARGLTHLSLAPEVEFGPDDILAVAEWYGPRGAEIAPGIPRVIMTQSWCFPLVDPYPSLPKPQSIHPYDGHEVLGAIAVSEMTKSFVEYISPNLPVWHTPPSIDPGLFHPNSRKVAAQIAYMPRRNREHSSQVLRLLSVRGSLDDVKIVPIDSVPLGQVGAALRSSEIFLSFGYPEGFGLPPAEAMASGCIVVGYHGEGGREFFDPEFCFPIEFGDIMGFAQTVEGVLVGFRNNPTEMASKSRKAAKYIMERYSRAREESCVLAAWGEILSARDQRRERAE